MENKENTKQATIDIIELFKIIWLNKKNILIWSTGGFILGIIIAVSIPNNYTTIVKIAPEEKNLNVSGSMGALASMMGVNTNSGSGGVTKELYPEIVKSTPFALEFANIPVNFNDEIIPFWKYQLKEQKKPWWNSIISLPSTIIIAIKNTFSNESNQNTPFDQSNQLQTLFVNNFANITSLQINKKTNIITINVVTQNPNISTQIADSAVIKLQKYMTKYRTAQTIYNLESNTIMLRQGQQKYYDIEQEYATVLDKNANLTSLKSKIRIERLKNERDLAFQIYQNLASQVALDKIKLNEQISIATVIEPARVPINKSSPNRLLTVIAFSFLMSVISSIKIIYCELK